MTIPNPFNGKTKTHLAIIYMLVVTIYIGIDKLSPKKMDPVTNQMVVDTTNRLTALETEMRSVEKSITKYTTENREDHVRLDNKLDTLVKALK